MKEKYLLPLDRVTWDETLQVALGRRLSEKIVGWSQQKKVKMSLLFVLVILGGTLLYWNGQNTDVEPSAFSKESVRLGLPRSELQRGRKTIDSASACQRLKKWNESMAITIRGCI